MSNYSAEATNAVRGALATLLQLMLDPEVNNDLVNRVGAQMKPDFQAKLGKEYKEIIYDGAVAAGGAMVATVLRRNADGLKAQAELSGGDITTLVAQLMDYDGTSAPSPELVTAYSALFGDLGVSIFRVLMQDPEVSELFGAKLFGGF